jgi:tRNA (cmo5U34)-methyltransferase
MTQQHSVETHLGIDVSDYDRAIRTLIPGYEQMLSTIVWWLSEVIPPDGRVIDLGGGTGALAESVLTALPGVRLEIWDADPKMLAIARIRLHKFVDRVSLRKRSFMEELEQCHAVIATLSLHHISTLDQKRALYTGIYQALGRSGIFLNGDCVMDLTEPAHSIMERYWLDFMGKHGISESDGRKNFNEWGKEDSYYQIFDELSTLADAGFRRPEVYWKEGPIAVYGGLKI